MAELPSGPASPWPRPGSQDRRSFPWTMLFVDVPSPLDLMKKEWAGSSFFGYLWLGQQSGEVLLCLEWKWLRERALGSSG